jgi:predicted TIM-barrel fold metal-dependent hydrolase
MRCDSHIHIVGPIEHYPQLANRSGIMGLAEIATVRGLGAARGISRFVIVQPSFYGTDNSMLLHGLDALGGLGRGVAVLDANSAKPDMLADWDRRGVRGLRLNLYSPVGPEKSIAYDFPVLADIAQTMNWHVEVIAPIEALVAHANLLASAKAPVVIDHYGVYGACVPDSAGGKGLLDLLLAPRVWIKLSAPYRVSANPLETRPNPAWLAAILAAAKARCVWGSDWPYTPPHESPAGAYRPIDYAVLVDDAVAALKAPGLADAILHVNPARLYGYPDSC